MSCNIEPTAGDGRDPSAMELDHVAIGHRVLASHVLAVEPGRSPYARVLEGAGEVLVDEARDVLHGLTAPEREGPVPVGRAARRLGVDAHEAEVPEEARTDLPETLPAARRHGESRIGEPGEVQEGPQLGLRIAEAVDLVGD